MVRLRRVCVVVMVAPDSFLPIADKARFYY